MQDTKAYREFTLSHYAVESIDGVDTIGILGRKSVVKDPVQTSLPETRGHHVQGIPSGMAAPCLPITAADPGEGRYASVRGWQQTNDVVAVEGALIGR